MMAAASPTGTEIGNDAEADDDGVPQAFHHGAVVPQLDEPVEREALEGDRLCG